jgi:acetyl esterase/lipase
MRICTGPNLAAIALVTLAVTPSAHAYEYTVEPPAGERGTIVLVHGGGWVTEDGPGFAENMRPNARMFARRGLRAVVASYPPGPTGIDDVLATVDRERARRGDDRVCLYGESAGGHWVLMAAARRRWLRCVVAVTAPTDLVGETLADPAGDLARLARRAFGAFRIPFLSPRQVAGDVRARVLLVDQRDDPLVARRHGISMHRALSRSTLVTLSPGSTRWMHGTASPAGIRAVRKRIAAFATRHVATRATGARTRTSTKKKAATKKR